MILSLSPVERALHRLHLLPTPVMDTFGSVLFGRMLCIAVRRGIFSAVAARSLSPDEIAERTALHPRATATIMEALSIGGYVRHTKGCYTLAPEGRRWLLPESPAYIGNLVRYFETLHTRWMNLEYALERGRPERMYFERFSEEDWSVYVHGMRDLAGLMMREVLRHLTLPAKATRVLDVGCSHGAYSAAMMKRYPGTRATLMDFPGALRHTQRFMKAEGMEDRVTYLPGDFTRMEFPADQDGILMFNIVHGLTEQENAQMLARAIRSLRPTGALYILDQLTDARRRGGLSHFLPLMVGLNLMSETGGTTYPFDAIRRWCPGGTRVRRIRLRLPGVEIVKVTHATPTRF